jgi:hypothetical protein
VKIWPSRNWTDKDTVEFWQLNEVSYNCDALKRPPMAHCVASNATGVESEAGWVPVTWDVPLIDTDEMSDGGTKLVINTPGMYIVRARFFWLPAYTGAAWGWPANGTANASDIYKANFMGAIGRNCDGQFQASASTGMLATNIQGVTGGNPITAPPLQSDPLYNTMAARVRLDEGDHLEAFAALSITKTTASFAVAGNSDTRYGTFSARFLHL